MTTTNQMTAQNFSHAEDITKSDSTVVNLDAIYVGGTGDVAVICQDDTAAITFKAVPVGTLLRMRITKVMSTNTTATLMVGLRA